MLAVTASSGRPDGKGVNFQTAQSSPSQIGTSMLLSYLTVMIEYNEGNIMYSTKTLIWNKSCTYI